VGAEVKPAISLLLLFQAQFAEDHFITMTGNKSEGETMTVKLYRDASATGNCYKDFPAYYSPVLVDTHNLDIKGD